MNFTSLFQIKPSMLEAVNKQKSYRKYMIIQKKCPNVNKEIEFCDRKSRTGIKKKNPDSLFVILILRAGSKEAVLCFLKHMTHSGSLDCGGVILPAKPDALSLGSRIHTVPSHTTKPSYSDAKLHCFSSLVSFLTTI